MNKKEAYEYAQRMTEILTKISYVSPQIESSKQKEKSKDLFYIKNNGEIN
jgi:hypothetical protein